MAAKKKESEAKGRPEIGMTKDRIFSTCWGRPSHTNTTTTASGLREQMVYESCTVEKYNHGFCRSYIYLTNGDVTAIQN